MTKHLSHRDWVAQQFEKYLGRSYRNALIHFSLIEGVLVKRSGMKTFNSANKFLLCSGQIENFEFCVFDEIRRIRNKITHRIFTKELDQDHIDKLRDDLMKKIQEAYSTSKFLDEHMFRKYDINRGKIVGKFKLYRLQSPLEHPDPGA